MAQASPNWATATVEELIAELAELGTVMAQTHEDLALDLNGYHRMFWSTWRQLNPADSVAARNRICENQAVAESMLVVENRGKLNALAARYDAVKNILDARLGRPLQPRSDLSDTFPPDQDLVLHG